MKELKVEFKNCFGIKEMEKTFDFEKSRTQLIYAKNGSMKTSFAKIFENYQSELGEKKEIKDILFSENKPVGHKIFFDSIEKEYKNENKDIFVIKPFEESYFSKNIKTTLLREKDLIKFNEFNEKLKNEKREFLNSIKDFFDFVKSENDDLTAVDVKKINTEISENILLEKEFKKIFKFEDKEFYEVLIGIKNKFNLDNKQKYSEKIKYSTIFNPTVTNWIDKNGIKNLLNKYIERYIEIINDSDYFNLKFNHQNAENILLELENKYDYFTVSDNEEENKEAEIRNGFQLVDKKGKIDSKNKSELKKIVNDIKEKVSSDPDSSKILLDIDKKITKGNKIIKFFRNYLVENIGLMVNFKDDINIIKEDLIISYLKNKYTQKNFVKLVENIEKILKERNLFLDKIEKDEKTLWYESVKEFNQRFDVPFDVFIEKEEKRLLLINDLDLSELKYRFCNGDKKDCVEGKKKWEIKEGSQYIGTLSQGEKRALYLLNIIFEIKYREQNNIKTLFIIDDIADSFDYKNKYAIVEYLQEIQNYESESGLKPFYSIILTHNFDFFRFTGKRLKIGKENLFEILREKNGKINLIKSENDEPWKKWKKNLKKKDVIALIPFVRNLIEYGLNNREDYLLLTHLLHDKKETKYKYTEKKNKEKIVDSGEDFIIPGMEDINFEEIEKIYQKYLTKESFDIGNKKEKVYGALHGLVKKIKDVDLNLESKIILAIDIRILSEKYLKEEIT